jgi:probable rRNA maturation factor
MNAEHPERTPGSPLGRAACRWHPSPICLVALCKVNNLQANDTNPMGRNNADNMASRFEIAVVRRSIIPGLSDARIRQAIRHVLRRHKVNACRIEVAIWGAERMRQLNERWLGHSGPTDVITFDLGDGPAGAGGSVTGQINVCRPIAQDQARRRNGTLAVELLLYVVHGALHLLDYDDHEPAAAIRMHRMEDRILGELGYGTVYAAPVVRGLRRRNGGKNEA